MESSSTRRAFIAGGGAAITGLIGIDASAAQDAAHGEHRHGEATAEDEFPRTHPGVGGPVGSPTDRGKLVPGFQSPTDPPVRVTTPDLDALPWSDENGVKVFHLVAEHVRREVLPNQWFDFWGFNGSMPGPTIEATQGDRVRIVVHNKLPEATSVHWHGLEVPIAMDGVPGLTQDPIPPGGEFVYEFDLHQFGTFFYHSHGAMQEIFGMVGLFIIHPREAIVPTIDHDFGLIVQEFAILPLSTIPNSISEEFNFFTINGRSGPYTTPLVVRLGSRVRIRFMNLSAMDHHPMHVHGHTFWITGTEGGRIPESAWIPSNNVLVAVGQSRDVEFIANNPGDWMLHCHIPHHMMNHMVSMVGPMAGMTAGQGHGKGSAMPEMKGGGLASGSLGAGLTPSLGPMTSVDREVMNAMRPSTDAAGFAVPGFPQDMMEMHGMMSPAELTKVETPLTRGMRRDWPSSTQAMMSILRVLPDELYDKVVSGKGDVEPGVSSPGAGRGDSQGHQGHEMPGMKPAKPAEKSMKHRHSPPESEESPPAEHQH